MIGIISLWLSIILSAVVVFIVSSILYMVLKYHRSDFSGRALACVSSSVIVPVL